MVYGETRFSHPRIFDLKIIFEFCRVGTAHQNVSGLITKKVGNAHPTRLKRPYTGAYAPVYPTTPRPILTYIFICAKLIIKRQL